MRKVVLLDDYFATGEQTIQPVLLWGPGRNQQDLSHVTKTASDALEYIKHVTPEPGKTHMLVLALGSEEAYGPNRNGDGFPERPVLAKSGKGKYWIEPGQELTHHYKTFETNPAHAFLHHVNKDPAKASGHVKKAFWNPKMHRVELLIVVDNKKDPEWVDRVNDGDFPAVSMGCRIKYDVCSICGNKAPTRAQYCDHVRFGMNQVNPDGTKNYVHNPAPNFFDISRVFRPADRTGYTLKKVAEAYEIRTSAELGEMVDAAENKAAAIRKLSDIDKIIRGQVDAAASLSDGEKEVIRKFRKHAAQHLNSLTPIDIRLLLPYKTAEALSTVSSLGMRLTTPEFTQYIASKLAGHYVPMSEALRRSVAVKQAAVFDILEKSPALLDEMLATGTLDEGPEHVVAALQDKLSHLATKRAGFGEYVYRRFVPEGMFRSPEASTLDVLHHTDPYTGQVHATTRGAALAARDAETRSDMRKLIGGGAALAAAYKLLTLHPTLARHKVPLAAATGALGYKLLRPGQHASVFTDEGYEVPARSEFAFKGASERLSSAVISLLDDYNGLPDSAFSRYNNNSLSPRLTKHAHIDRLHGVELDFDAVAQEVGEMICG